MALEQTLTETKFTDGIRDLTAQEVFELEDQMRELLATPGWQRLIEWIERSRASARSSMEGHRTLEQATYARLGGFLAALSRVEETPAHVIRKAEKVREDLAAMPQEDEVG